MAKYAIALYASRGKPGRLYVGDELLGPFETDREAVIAGRDEEHVGIEGPPVSVLVFDGEIHELAAKVSQAA